MITLITKSGSKSGMIKERRASCGGESMLLRAAGR
jgi:hypothetical protein